MSRRDLLKKVIPKDLPETMWNCGEDVPITFTVEEQKAMQFKTIKHNYRTKAISKAIYTRLMERARNS